LPAHRITKDVRSRRQLPPGRVETAHLQNGEQPGRDRENPLTMCLLVLRADGHLASIEVDILPLERKELAGSARGVKQCGEEAAELRIGGCEQLFFIAVVMKPAVSRDFAIERNRGLCADLEGRLHEESPSDAPIEHLPQQLEIVIDGASGKAFRLAGVLEGLDVASPDLV
jgi:hypothetical protein